MNDGHLVADGFDHLHLVGDEQYGQPQLAVDLFKQGKDGVGGLGIQRRGRFIAEQHLGLGSQRPGDGHALLLTAGQLAGIGVGPLT